MRRLGRQSIAGPAWTFAGRTVTDEAIAELTLGLVGLQSLPGSLGLTNRLFVEDLSSAEIRGRARE